MYKRHKLEKKNTHTPKSKLVHSRVRLWRQTFVCLRAYRGEVTISRVHRTVSDFVRNVTQRKRSAGTNQTILDETSTRCI